MTRAVVINFTTTVNCIIRHIVYSGFEFVLHVVLLLLRIFFNQENISGWWNANYYIELKFEIPTHGKGQKCMMASSNGKFLCVTGHLCEEFTGPRWIPHTKASDVELWCFLWSASESTLSKQSWGWWFETLPRPLWRHCFGIKQIIKNYDRCGVGNNELNTNIVILPILPMNETIIYTRTSCTGIAIVWPLSIAVRQNWI